MDQILNKLPNFTNFKLPPIFSIFLKIPFLMYKGINFINGPIHKVFQALPFLYTLLAIVCIVLAVIILIILLFSKFLFFPATYATFIDKNIAQQIYSTLHLLYSFLLLCAIVHVTFFKDINSPDINPINVLGNIVNNNTAGIIIIQVLLVSIIVIFMFLMSVVSNALSKAYYTLKVRETNIYETPSMSGWAKIVDLIMYTSCIISSILLIFFFVIKIFVPKIPIPIKSSIQTFFVISIVYYISQLFLQMLRDVISDNLLSFVIPTTHTNKILYFVLNIILAIIIWVGIIFIIFYNLILFSVILKGYGEVLDIANKGRSLFYGIIPPALSKYIEPYLKKAGIDPNNIQESIGKVTQTNNLLQNTFSKLEMPPALQQALPEQALPEQALQQALPEQALPQALPTTQALPTIQQAQPTTRKTLFNTKRK